MAKKDKQEGAPADPETRPAFEAESGVAEVPKGAVAPAPEHEDLGDVQTRILAARVARLGAPQAADLVDLIVRRDGGLEDATGEWINEGRTGKFTGHVAESYLMAGHAVLPGAAEE